MVTHKERWVGGWVGGLTYQRQRIGCHASHSNQNVLIHSIELLSEATVLGGWVGGWVGW